MQSKVAYFVCSSECWVTERKWLKWSFFVSDNELPFFNPKWISLINEENIEYNIVVKLGARIWMDFGLKLPFSLDKIEIKIRLIETLISC